MSSLVFDIEGNGLMYATKLWCISIQDMEEDRIYSYTDMKEGIEHLNRATTLIGHNILGYDLPKLEKLHGWIPKKEVNIVDTLILSRLGHPDREKPPGYTGKSGPHSLECWGYRVCRAKPHHEDWSVYSPAMLERNREDVGINKLTSHLISSELVGHDWSKAIDIENNVLRIITKQEYKGVLFDVDGANDLVERLTNRINDIDAKLIPGLPIKYSIRGVPVSKPFLNSGHYSKMVTDWYPTCSIDTDNFVAGPFCRVEEIRLDLGSIKQVKDYLLTQGWKPTQWNFKDGERTSPKLTEDSFVTITGNIGTLIKERFLCIHRRSQISGWLSRVREDGRLTASANTCGTNTGRFRHSNVVNVPKAVSTVPYGIEMRALFTVPEDHYLIGHDASGLELRMLAHYMNDSKFTEEILNGDIHTANQLAAGLPTRDHAKTFIYAFNYGAGDERLGSIVGGSSRDGREVRNKFLAGLPNLKRLITRVKQASNKGWLKGLDGRRLWMRRNEDGNIQKNKALNTLLQGAGAIVMKKSMILLDQWVMEEGLRAYKVLDMHDEAQAEVHFEDKERYMELAELSVVKSGEYFNLNIPLAAEAKCGRNWSETH